MRIYLLLAAVSTVMTLAGGWYVIKHEAAITVVQPAPPAPAERAVDKDADNIKNQIAGIGKYQNYKHPNF